MAARSYDAALARLLAHEGGYTNHPADPGGPTNFGITIYDYRKYVKPDASAADVRAMKVEEAKAINRSKYWNAQRCDELPAGVDYAVFDYGVNSGIGRSGKVLRRVLGLSAEDWRTSYAVLAALSQRDAKQIIGAICDERLRFLQSLKTWGVFGKGWGARVAEVKAFALQLAAGAAAVVSSDPKTEQAGKGVVPLPKAAQQGSAGAIVATGAAAAHQAHQVGAGAGTVVIIAAALARLRVLALAAAAATGHAGLTGISMETVMELALIFFLMGAVAGAALGYWLCAHIHSAATTSAVTRATTISSGEAAALNTKIDGLGNALQGIAATAQAPAVAAMTAAVNAAPKPVA